ncbi:response regulator [Magnetococcales bacterium HHB-1]
MSVLEKNRILIVEDDEETRHLLCDYLDQNGCQPTAVWDGEGMWHALTKNPFDLIVLDIMLPGEDGLTLCRNLRAKPETATLPVIMLTARGDETDRIIGLEMGADDYLAKPFSSRELLARIRSVLRRVRAQPTDQSMGSVRAFRFAGWRLVVQSRELISPKGVLVPLTRAEFALLRILLENPHTTLSREQIAELDGAGEITVYDRGVDMRIGRLRKRLHDNPRKPTLIQTMRGVGYRLNCDVEKE